MPNYPDPLRVLDLSQTRAAAVIASVSRDQMFLPTPCDLWDVKDVINKLVASTRLFTGFGLRQPADLSLDLINPKDLIGDDPVGVYLSAAKECRDAWRSPGALDGLATSTIGEAKAKAVLNARIFDTTVLTWGGSCQFVSRETKGKSSGSRFVLTWEGLCQFSMFLVRQRENPLDPGLDHCIL